MAKNLVIVESPAKAKTIEKYLGKEFVVKSCFGHIRDLPKKGLNIDIEHDFKPTYEISPDKKKIVADLKKSVGSASEVWLASDEDREGEAIAWHLSQALKLSPNKTKRIVFHEITKSAIEQAIQNPRAVDPKLVDAQQARRVLDRLVGYELSPVLWKKVRAGLSAGRVQSVAVRLIVEREREIKAFEPAESYKVSAIFSAKGEEFKAMLAQDLATKAAAHDFLKACMGQTFTITDVGKKPGSRSPGPPFTTSSLQQEAARRLGFSVKQTMTLAQRLYEEGNITYMRTDSTILSTSALTALKAYIVGQFGQPYHTSRQYKTKTAGAQEAHEAIRPTHVRHLSAGADSQQQKLYQLIWQRAVASQMAPARFDRTEVSISISSLDEIFVAKGESLIFDGFMKVYGGTKEDVLLPALSQGQKVEPKLIAARQTFSKPPARYSEASLVKKLEELGIGRPSTYAPTISTIQNRGYIEKSDPPGTDRNIVTLELKPSKTEIIEAETVETTGADRAKLLPTALADITTDFLVKYFGDIIDYDFTARVEADFDHIAAGKQQWAEMIGDFYKSFHPLVAQSEKASRQETSQARLLGKDPKTKQPIYARFGRYGPMLQRGKTEAEEKPDFAPLPEETDLNEVTLEQALEMFELPRKVGSTPDGQEITANIGRFGPYIQVDKTFVSIKPLDPRKITEAEARKLYEAKLKKDAEKYIQRFKGGIQVINGPYGPYITDGKKNAKVPDGQDPKKLTEAEARKLLDAAPVKKRRFPAGKK